MNLERIHTMKEVIVSLTPELEKEVERLEAEYLGEFTKEEICKMLLELGIKKTHENGM